MQTPLVEATCRERISQFLTRRMNDLNSNKSELQRKTKLARPTIVNNLNTGSGDLNTTDLLTFSQVMDFRISCLWEFIEGTMPIDDISIQEQHGNGITELNPGAFSELSSSHGTLLKQQRENLSAEKATEDIPMSRITLGTIERTGIATLRSQIVLANLYGFKPSNLWKTIEEKFNDDLRLFLQEEKGVPVGISDRAALLMLAEECGFKANA